MTYLTKKSTQPTKNQTSMKHLYQFSMLLLVLLLPATALAHDFYVDGIYYNINGNEVSVTYRGSSYNSYANEYSGSVTIPATVTYGGNTFSVTAIGDEAFFYCESLTSIDIPNSVTSIGNRAFASCSALTNITIPISVIHLGDEAFLFSSLETLNFNAENCNDFGDEDNPSQPFSGTNISTINIGSSVKRIPGHFAAGMFDLTNIDIPNSVTSIGDYAFSVSGLTNVKLGCSITTIGNHAFEYCGIKSVTIPNSVISIGNDAFFNCSGLTSIDIPNSVTTIGDYAFSGCSGLASIDIPNSITSIGEGVCYECTGLTCVTIPNSVTIIGVGAFSSCSGLTSVIIGNSVTFIGGHAFDVCSNLTEIYCWALTPPRIGFPGSFDDNNNATLYVPEIALDSYKFADDSYWSIFANIIGVPYTFEVDGTNYHATTMNTASVMANNDEAALYSGDVVIPDSVTYEGMSFAVTGIESNAFDGCFELTSITIPNSVETIGEQAFQGCTGLTSVTIGSGVTDIGAKSFNYCNALETVKCIGTVPPVMASTDCFSTAAYNRATLLVPRNTEATYAAADYWYKFTHIDGWGSAGQGDVNGDGVMSITDVTSLIDVLLGHELDSFYFDSADLNSNGRLDIGDVTTLIDNLLNGDY